MLINQKRIIGCAMIGISALFFSSFFYVNDNSTIQAQDYAMTNDTRDPHPKWQAGKTKHLPIMNRNEVKKHSSADDLWLTYRNGVYDLTSFADSHPGSVERLLLATYGNCDICQWWKQLGYHNVQTVHQMLERYRIGDLKSTDVIDCDTLSIPVSKELKESRESMYDSAFSYEPFIAETPVIQLDEYYYTPVEYHYVRSHFQVPLYLTLDDELSISGIGVPKNEYCIKYKDILSLLPSVTIDVYLQCGGHRRSEYNAFAETKGSKWNMGAIGNGKYRGVLLRDLLSFVGVDVEHLYYNNDRYPLYVHFIGADVAPDGEAYGVSIPLHKALDPKGDVLLAYEHNGKCLTLDHGFPMRVLVPGYVASRSIKWVESIVISDVECQLKSYTKSYRMTKDMEQEIRELPVNSAIHYPVDGQILKNGEKQLVIRGEAHSGGGHGIIRVDVSVDGGKHWLNAQLLNGENDKRKRNGRQWNWCKWQCIIDFEKYKNVSEFEIVCRAFDTAHNRQPESCEADLTFNPKGYGANCYHKINVYKK